MESEKNKQYMNVKEVANYLKVSPRTIRGLTGSREIPFSRVAGCIRFERGEIDRWFKQNSHKPKAS